MNASGTSTNKLSTSQQLVSTGYPCLKRHEVTLEYYGVKKHRGKIKQVKLRTASGLPISDRKLAEKALRQWLENLDAPTQDEKPNAVTFEKLLEKHRAVNAGLAESSRDTVEWIIGRLRGSWSLPLNSPISGIKTSDIAAWIARQNDLKPASYNELLRQLKNIFALAVADGAIEKSPYDPSLIKRKKVRKERRNAPSVEQFEQIVHAIRTQRFADHKEDSADLAAFLGHAALGEAEANLLDWKHVDFQSGIIHVRRKKTGVPFDVPIFPHLKPLLLEMHQKQGSPAIGKVFKVTCCKRTLQTVCKNLGFPRFTPRSLRQMGIVRLLRAGINVKLVSKWQGHSDGGKLILDTYSDVITASDSQFEQAELKKLAA